MDHPVLQKDNTMHHGDQIRLHNQYLQHEVITHPMW